MSLEVYVGNYPCTLTSEDILSLFGDFEGIKVLRSKKKDLKCFSFLLCVDQEQVIDVVTMMHDIDVCGRNLIVRASDTNLQKEILESLQQNDILDKHPRNRHHSHVIDSYSPVAVKNKNHGTASNNFLYEPHIDESNEDVESDIPRYGIRLIKPQLKPLDDTQQSNTTSHQKDVNYQLNSHGFNPLNRLDSNFQNKLDRPSSVGNSTINYNSVCVDKQDGGCQPLEHKNKPGSRGSVIQPDSEESKLSSQNISRGSGFNPNSHFKDNPSRSNYAGRGVAIKSFDHTDSPSGLGFGRRSTIRPDSDYTDSQSRQYNARGTGFRTVSPFKENSGSRNFIGRDSVTQSDLEYKNSSSRQNFANRSSDTSSGMEFKSNPNQQNIDGDFGIRSDFEHKDNSCRPNSADPYSEVSSNSGSRDNRRRQNFGRGSHIRLDSEYNDRANRSNFDQSSEIWSNSDYTDYPRNKSFGRGRRIQLDSYYESPNRPNIGQFSGNRNYSKVHSGYQDPVGGYNPRYINPSEHYNDESDFTHPSELLDVEISKDDLFYVMVVNFPIRTTVRELYFLFSDFHPFHVIMICNEPTPDKDPTEAIICFQTQKDATNAIINLDNTMYHQRALVVTDATDISDVPELLKIGSKNLESVVSEGQERFTDRFNRFVSKQR